MVDLAKYVVSLEAQTKDYVRKLDDANRKLSDFHKSNEKSLANLQSSFTRNFSRINSVLGAFGVALSVSAVVGWVKTSIQAVDALGDFSKATGIAVERLQELRYAAKLSGVEVQAHDKAIQQFARRLGEFQRTGAGPAADLFKQLPIQLRDARGQFLPIEQALDNTVKVLSRFKNEAQLSALATLAFGREGADLVPMLKEGTAGIQKASEELRKFGGVIGKDTVEKMQKLDDELDKLGARWDAFWARATVNAMHGLDRSTKGLQDLVGLLRKLQTESTPKVNQQENPLAAQAEFLLSQGQEVDLVGLAKEFDGIGKSIEKAAEPSFDFYNGLKEITVAAPKMGEALSRAEQEAAALGMTFEQMPKFEPLTIDVSEIDIAAMKAKTAFGEVKTSADEAAESVGMTWERMPQFIAPKLDPIKAEFEELGATLNHGLRDSLVDFLVDGELRFKEFIKRMAAEWLVSDVFKSLSVAFGGSGGFLAGLFGGNRAQGGPLEQGKWYIAGEKGPEPIWGGGPGAFAMGYAGGGGVGDVHVHIEQNFNSDLTPDRAVAMGQLIGQSVYEAVNKRLGGRR